MKTVNTVLPIYNSLSKQCFERGKKGGINKPVPVITPQWRLPSFQWLDIDDGASSVSMIELIDFEGTSYNISMAFDSWTNVNFDTFVSSGLNITNAVHTVVGFASATLKPDASIWMAAGESLNVKCILTRNPGDSGNPISFTFYELGAPISSTVLIDGSNSITYTMSNPGYVDIGIFSNGASRFSLTEVRVTSGAFNNFFPTLPAAYAYDSDVYFMYNGDTLNYLLPLGTYYLKITMDTGHVYYSDWFRVECICSNLISEWLAAPFSTYDTFITEGTAILQATTATSDNSQSNDINVVIGDEFRVITYITNIAGLELPEIYLVDPGIGAKSNKVSLSAGINDVTLTATATGTFRLMFNNNNQASWEATEVMVFREYCEDYLQLTFSHSCNLGDIKYEDDFEQVIYLDTEAMEPIFPYEEKGQENGYGVFVPTWQKQDKQYIIRTKLVPQFLVDVLHRLKLHDSITLLDNVGDSFAIEEIDVEHEWQFGDKYYAIVTLTVSLGEKIVITGCCSAINECTGGSSSTTCDEKYIKTDNLSAGVETDITTTLTDEPYNVMILDSSGNDITSLVTLRIGLDGGVYHFYVYSVDALSNVKFKVIY